MPTTATYAYSIARVEPKYSGEAQPCPQELYKVKASSTLAAGTVVGAVTASPGTIAAYVAGHSDGTQLPIGILEYAVTTDSGGNITNANEWGVTPTNRTPVWMGGAFDTSDLTGLDSAGATALGGRLVQATTANEELWF